MSKVAALQAEITNTENLLLTHLTQWENTAISSARALSPLRQIGQHPFLALGLAVGCGMLVGHSLGGLKKSSDFTR